MPPARIGPRRALAAFAHHCCRSPLPRLSPPQVLIFLAYYCETIPEASEVVRSREVILKYHTEDDTVALHEPRVTNAGLPQGKMLRRMRVPLAATQLPARELVGIMPPARPSGPALRAAVVGEHLTWRELVVGEQLGLFGRALRVIACDARTRKWYEAQGQPQPHDLVVHAPKPHHMATAASPVIGGPPSATAAPVPFFGKRVNPEKRYLEVRRPPRAHRHGAIDTGCAPPLVERRPCAARRLRRSRAASRTRRRSSARTTRATCCASRAATTTAGAPLATS